MSLTERILFEPSYKKGSNLNIRFIVSNVMGAVDFVVETNWQTLLSCCGTPLPQGNTYHSRKKLSDADSYEGHCPYIDDRCYASVSGLHRYKFWEVLLTEGHEGVFRLLRILHTATFHGCANAENR